MEYELKTLENVLEILHPDKLKRESINASFIGKYKRIAYTEKERIKMQFIQSGFEPGSEKRIELYVRQHQRSLVKLADTVYYYIHPKGKGSIYRISKETAIIKFYKEIYNCIEWLLNFLEHRYAVYFDKEAKIPEECKQFILPEFTRNKNLIENELTKKELSPNFVNIIIHPFEDCLLSDAEITYRELFFLKELQREIIELLKKPGQRNYSEEINNLFLYLNFNSIRFFNFYIIQLEETAKKCNGTVELIEFYSLKMKLINQLLIKPGLVYKVDLPSIRNQIGTWITEELYYLEKQRQLLLIEPLQKNLPMDNESKVHTSLSVAHLSLAVKLLIDAKVITNRNSREVIKMVARNFRTDKREQISEDSLYNKTYNIEPATLDGMKDVIIGLMNLVKRY